MGPGTINLILDNVWLHGLDMIVFECDGSNDLDANCGTREAAVIASVDLFVKQESALIVYRLYKKWIWVAKDRSFGHVKTLSDMKRRLTEVEMSEDKIQPTFCFAPSGLGSEARKC